MNDEHLFLEWLSDGGGEQDFMRYEDTTVSSFDYSYAFPAWGYDPKVHGEPVVILQAEA